MNYLTVRQLQKRYGVAKVQQLIDNGEAFRFEGEFGELVWSMIHSGACMLPNVVYKDHTGKMIAARQMVPKGSVGSFQRCSDYWQGYINKINQYEY